METLNVILPNLRAQDWAVSIDLKDAYLHVPVHPQSRRLLGFKFLDKNYMYKVLPFGLKDSPWVFSREVATVVAHLRLQGIRIFYYLDDWLLVAESQMLLLAHLQATLQLSQSLGFIFNWKKSVLTPQRMPVYLRASLDIPRLIVRSVERRVVALQSLIQELTASPVAPALLWQKVLGHSGQFRGSGPELQASHAASSAALHSVFYSSVGLSVKADSFDSGNQGSVCSLGVSGSTSRRETFLPPPSFPGADLRCLPVRLGCDSPTSSGFRHLVQGGVLGPYQFSRTQAVFLALKSLEVHVRGQSLLVRSDNTTVVSYINYQGGTHSPSLCFLAIELWEWCVQRGIHLSAAHIPGEDNLVADFLSRGKFLPSEWTLNPLIFQRICQVLVSQPEIDLFCVHPQLPTSQVLCPLQGSSSLEGGRTLLPVVRSSTVCLPTLFDSSHSSGEDRSGRSRRGSGGPHLASETMVPEVVVSSGGTSQTSPSSEGPCLSTHVSSASSKAGESSSLTLAAFREKGKQAGLSARATEFSAEALRESTRASYDSKLECFFKWCNNIPCVTPLLPL